MNSLQKLAISIAAVAAGSYAALTFNKEYFTIRNVGEDPVYPPYASEIGTITVINTLGLAAVVGLTYSCKYLSSSVLSEIQTFTSNLNGFAISVVILTAGAAECYHYLTDSHNKSHKKHISDTFLIPSIITGATIAYGVKTACELALGK